MSPLPLLLLLLAERPAGVCCPTPRESSPPEACQSAHDYPWTRRVCPADTLVERVPPPAGFERVAAPAQSFASWLRGLPLLSGRPEVLLFNGQPKANQSAHAAVVDVDVGDEDLQQCADAVIRLRAEYLFARGQESAIHFRFTSGDEALWSEWRRGVRPRVTGARVQWRQEGHPDGSYASFRRYLTTVFRYAGTASLAAELLPIPLADLQPGDVFVEGGHPGHAVIVLDVAAAANGRRVFLLAQSYMPAQQMHLLVNPGDPGLSPWYGTGFGEHLVTPEWEFSPRDLRRFR